VDICAVGGEALASGGGEKSIEPRGEAVSKIAAVGGMACKSATAAKGRDGSPAPGCISRARENPGGVNSPRGRRAGLNKNAGRKLKFLVPQNEGLHKLRLRLGEIGCGCPHTPHRRK